MYILAIDPGPDKSAWCIYGTHDGKPVEADICSIGLMLHHVQNINSHRLRIEFVAIEGLACYGMPVGAEVFNTAYFIGRLMESCGRAGLFYSLVYRKDVKMHLCGTMKAKDANIRQALIDRFGDKGTKKNPGVLYGYHADMFSALAVAVTASETILKDGKP